MTPDQLARLDAILTQLTSQLVDAQEKRPTKDELFSMFNGAFVALSMIRKARQS